MSVRVGRQRTKKPREYGPIAAYSPGRCRQTQDGVLPDRSKGA